MTRLERELLTRIKARLDALDPGAAEKLAVLLPVLRRFAQSYAALGAAAKKTVEALLPELAALLAGGDRSGMLRSDAMSAEQTGAFFALVSVCSGLGSVLSLLLLLAKPVRERLFGLSAIREGQKCMLRADMLAAYYKHREEKTIRQYEYENFLYEYKAYKALRGNSFIERIAREVAEWEIVT